MPLVLVVGPSGAGKDTLMAEANGVLGACPDIVFVRRVVTRQAVPRLEDHDVLDDAAFAAAHDRGAFALSWQAHGLSYGLPASIDADLNEGRIVVANCSRRAIPAALAKYPDTVAIVVDADPTVRSARLEGRGRETRAEIVARIARDTAAFPEGLRRISIDNSGLLADGVAAFVTALRNLAAERSGASGNPAALSQ